MAHMTSAIMLFEVRQRLRSVSAYIYFLVVFLLGFLAVVTTGGALGFASFRYLVPVVES